jgi:hypothetical protein
MATATRHDDHEEAKAALLECREGGMTATEAYQTVGVSSMFVTRAKRADEDFAEAWESYAHVAPARHKLPAWARMHLSPGRWRAVKRAMAVWDEPDGGDSDTAVELRATKLVALYCIVKEGLLEQDDLALLIDAEAVSPWGAARLPGGAFAPWPDVVARISERRLAR